MFHFEGLSYVARLESGLIHQTRIYEYKRSCSVFFAFTDLFTIHHY
jgi:hypothetical protein